MLVTAFSIADGARACDADLLSPGAPPHLDVATLDSGTPLRHVPQPLASAAWGTGVNT